MPEQQPELIAADEPGRQPGRPTMPARIANMIALYGPSPHGDSCAYCVHLVAIHRTRAFYKCSQATITAGAATDWRRKWPGCGKFEIQTAERPQRHIYPSD